MADRQISLEMRARLIGDVAGNIAFAGNPEERRKAVAHVALEHLLAVARGDEPTHRR